MPARRINSPSGGYPSAKGSPVATELGTVFGQPLLATFTVTSAMLLALNGTPVVNVLPAPGAGKSLYPVNTLWRFNWGTTQYTGGGAMKLYWHGGSTNILAATVPASFVTTPTGAVTTDVAIACLATDIAPPQNTGLDLTCATANFAAGDSTLTIFVWYHQI